LNDARSSRLTRTLSVHHSRRDVMAALTVGALGIATGTEANGRAGVCKDAGRKCRASGQCQSRRCRKKRARRLGKSDGLESVTRYRAHVVPVFGYRVAAEYRHDAGAFTQGLAYVDGVLYEGTGLMGESTLRRVDLESGEVLQSVALDASLFGEGITVLGDRIYQLTWRNHLCLVFDRETFTPIETFTYANEGWGLTTDGTQLIASDGTNRLVFRDPATFAEVGHVDVFDGEEAVNSLNELELVDGEIWANVWRSDRIARIDPVSGQVRSWLDLTGLLSADDREGQNVDVLNGIAHDRASGRLFVTGKRWPKLFTIEVDEGDRVLG
jgi:glutaminyl-peptide cyclotransferase